MRERRQRCLKLTQFTTCNERVGASVAELCGKDTRFPTPPYDSNAPTNVSRLAFDHSVSTRYGKLYNPPVLYNLSMSHPQTPYAPTRHARPSSQNDLNTNPRALTHTMDSVITLPLCASQTRQSFRQR